MKHTGKAVKRMIPHMDRHGRNMSYYREVFWLQDPQTQFELYMSGAAPKMNMMDVRKVPLRDSKGDPRRFFNRFKMRSVMYATHLSPRGTRVPPTDIVEEAEDAKEDAKKQADEKKAEAAAKLEAKKRKKMKKKESEKATAAITGKTKAKANVNASANATANTNANPDALPFFATPDSYITMQKVRVRPRPVTTTARPQQRQEQQPQGQIHRPPQHAQPQPRLSTHPEPQLKRQTRQPEVVRPQMQRPQGHQSVSTSAPATRQSYPAHGGLRPASQGQGQGQARVRQSAVVVPVMGQRASRGTGRRVAGQSVAGSEAGSSSRW
jgi:hypothetical protein